MTSETLPFTIGTHVTCQDGAYGVLTRVVVDPLAHDLTHLVVEPAHHRTAPRLVPVDLVDPDAAPVALRCTNDAVDALPSAEETQFLPEWKDDWGYPRGHVLAWPYYGLGTGSVTALRGTPGLGPDQRGYGPIAVTRDLLPEGEVAIRRGEPVHATDGTIGRVQGLVVDPGNHRVSHVLLDEGHLWGKRTVAIPVAAVTGVSGGVRLDLTKDEVRDLPSIDLDHP
ncbi:PRC-barrel domain-containing protein [Streptacidiphilus sp. PAMC 29251]